MGLFTVDDMCNAFLLKKVFISSNTNTSKVQELRDLTHAA